jgi:hypothetical protein
MKPIIALFSLIVTLFSIEVQAAPSERSAKTDVTGTIVDNDHGILILKDFKGWDRKQTEYVTKTLRPNRRSKWLESFDATHAAIVIKKDDVKQIRKGMRITIEGYSYLTDEWDIYPDYQKLTVTKNAEQRADGKPAKPRQ